MARRERRLAEAGVTFRELPPGRVEESVLEDLFRLNEARWRLKGVPSTFHPDQREFHRKLIARGAPGRGPVAVVAERDGKTIGVVYGFLWRDTYFGYQNGWAPEWADMSLGRVLYSRSILFARSLGAQVIDLLRGWEPWKREVGATEVRWDETWLVPRGFSGRMISFKFHDGHGSPFQRAVGYVRRNRKAPL